MNIHHKNMKQIACDMNNWRQKNLSPYGIFEVNYTRYDIKNKTWIVMPSMYDWYCKFMEQDLDLHIAQRLKSGWKFWDKEDITFKKYEKFLAIKNVPDTHKNQIVSERPDGFEMLAVSSHNKLTQFEQMHVEKAFRSMSYQAESVIKSKPNILLDFRGVEQIPNLSKPNALPEMQYEKSNFKGLILTAKEQLYIEYLLFNLSHKEVAYKQNCSQTAVRKIYLNIKRKLGCSYMPTSTLLKKLNEHDVLSLYSIKFNS
tara:strand:+ start:306 stop:1076 length:771 start_codon:yes stop_codon:yes gene_type:complete